MAGLLFGLVVVAVIAMFVYQSAANDKRRKDWAGIAERRGFAHDGKDLMSGTVDESSVVVDIFTRSSGKNSRTYTRVAVSGGLLPADVSFGREALFDGDMETGDAAFDKVVSVEGKRAALTALLDSDTRAVVRRAIDHHWSYNGSAWIFQRQAKLGIELDAIIDEGVALAARFRELGRNVPRRLLDSVMNDPEVAIRKECLALLDARYRESKQRRAAFQAALADSDPELRLIAGLALGDVPVLSGLAGTRDVAASIRARALGQVLDVPDDPHVIATVDVLLDELDAEMEPQLVIALVKALRVVSNERAEPTLVAMLEWSDGAVKVEVIKSLGKVGTIDSVRLLTPLRDVMFAALSETAGAAKDAILQIQARAGGGEAGALSVTEADSGLALVDEPIAERVDESA